MSAVVDLLPVDIGTSSVNEKSAVMTPDLISTLEGLRNLKIIDLSHTLEEGIPFFPTHTVYRHIPCVSSMDPAFMFSLEIHEHSGTHMDAPMHYLKDVSKLDINKHAISSLELKNMFGSCRVVKIEPDQNNLISKMNLEKWEKKNGCSISDYDFLFFYFGWEHKWSNDESNVQYSKNWPGLSKDCCEYILEKNPLIKGVGTDCLGLDQSDSTDIPAHDILLKNAKFIYENLNNLSELLKYEVSLFMAYPLKIYMGSGSPIRAIAFTKDEKNDG